MLSSCRVNGAVVPIERADYLIRAVPVPAGTARVVFRYVNWPLRIGAGITLTTLLGGACALRWVAKKRHRQQ